MTATVSGFRPPKESIYRSFVYLDVDDVINSLSGILGGDVDEVLTRATSENGSGFELGADARFAKVSGNKRKQRQYEEEVRRTRTAHSAAAKLLERLHERDAIGVIDSYSPEVREHLTEGMVVELRAPIRMHPLHQTQSLMESFITAAPILGQDGPDLDEAREVIPMVRQFLGGSDGESMIAYAVTSAPSDHRLVLPMVKRHLLASLEELDGTVTIIGQVSRKLGAGEEQSAMRMLRDAPMTPLEREGIQEALPGLFEALSGFGIDADLADVMFTDPAVIIRPIMIFR